MALTPFDMEGVNRDLLAAGNPAKPDMQSILRRNARDLVLGNAILVSSVDAKELEFGVHMAYSDAAGCSDDLVHGHGQSHVGAGGGFHGVAHFVLHEADVTHGGGDVGVPQHTADKHDVAAVPVVDACGEPTAQAVRRVSGYRLDPLRHVIDAAVSLHVSGEQPYAGAFPQCRSELCRHGKHPLLVALAVDVEHHALGVLLQIGLQVDPGHLDAPQATERAQHDGQPRVLVG